MKKLLPIICCMFLLGTTKAQFVNIKDSAFMYFLKYNYPSCIDSQNRLDTSCSEVLNDSIMDIIYPITFYQVNNIYELKYFKNLKHLQIGEQLIDSISFLPSKLKSLRIYQDPIRYIKKFPDSLEYLRIDGDLSLGKLPSIPATVTFLQIRGCNLKSFPALPPNLEYFDCTNDSILILPQLPTSLIILRCPLNMLSNLPQLGNKVELLDMSYNEFKQIPTTINSNLVELDITNNNIDFVRNIPKGLRVFTNYTQFVANKICYEYLPNSMREFNLSSWATSCIPNNPDSCKFYNYQSSIPSDISWLICNPTNNIERCQSFPAIQSFTYTDLNNNNKLNTNEFPKHNLKLKLSNSNYAYANTNGSAFINADSLGTYTITATAPPFYNAVPSSYTHNFSSYDTIVYDTFALQANVLKDSIAIKLTPTNWAARAGRSYPYLVNYENVGTTVLSNAAISLQYDNSLLIYDSSSVSGVANSGNTLSLNVGNIIPGQTGSFIAYFKVATTAVLNSSIVTVAGIATNTVVATDTVQSIVRGSYDPNDKQATPSLTPQQISAGKDIDYTIRFQNTGTDTAFNVVIADTLNSKLQANQVQMIGSSHSCKTTVKDNIIFFEFLDIMLPDSNVNNTGSNGFVSFRIKPINSITAGNFIPNNAAIYFDYNKPIITNTATTIIQNPLPLQLLGYEASPTPPKEGLKNWTVLNKWTTLNEINTSHFIIQRSNDGRVYTSIGSVAAKGFGEYNFIDNNLPSNFSVLYYQLQIVDKDGRFTYSKVIKIASAVDLFDGLMVVKNPAKNKLQLKVNSSALNNSNASVVNTQGKVVKQFVLQQGYQTIDISGIAAGVYILQSKQGSKKVVVE